MEELSNIQTMRFSVHGVGLRFGESFKKFQKRLSIILIFTLWFIKIIVKLL